MLADTPIAFVESLAAARRQTDAQWRERTTTMTSGSSVTIVADHGTEGSKLTGIMRVVLKEQHVLSDLRRAMLVSVYVAPEHRGSGLAERLLQEACSVALEELGAEMIELGVHEDNARARAFYERHGFEATGETKPYALDESKREVVMARPIHPLSDAPQQGRRAAVGH
ncbi:GNAT family N-acetyltransferase [bacterium RCC_150]